MLALIERYPQYILIPAHAGGECGKEYLELAEAVRKHKWEHVYTDTSFKGAEVMKDLTELMGEDKILFGTDYPFGEVEASIEQCKRHFPVKKMWQIKYFTGMPQCFGVNVISDFHSRYCPCYQKTV